MQPYCENGSTFLDVQTVIPIPEVADYQIRIREKKQSERQARKNSRDTTRFDVSIAGNIYEALSKRWMMYHLVRDVLSNGGTPEEIGKAISWRKKRLFLVFEGHLDGEDVCDEIMKNDGGGRYPRTKRYFTHDDEIFHLANKTYVMSNQWGSRTLEAVENLTQLFPKLKIQISPVSSM